MFSMSAITETEPVRAQMIVPKDQRYLPGRQKSSVVTSSAGRAASMCENWQQETPEGRFLIYAFERKSTAEGVSKRNLSFRLSFCLRRSFTRQPSCCTSENSASSNG